MFILQRAKPRSALLMYNNLRRITLGMPLINSREMGMQLLDRSLQFSGKSPILLPSCPFKVDVGFSNVHASSVNIAMSININNKGRQQTH